MVGCGRQSGAGRSKSEKVQRREAAERKIYHEQSRVRGWVRGVMKRLGWVEDVAGGKVKNEGERESSRKDGMESFHNQSSTCCKSERKKS